MRAPAIAASSLALVVAGCGDLSPTLVVGAAGRDAGRAPRRPPPVDPTPEDAGTARDSAPRDGGDAPRPDFVLVSVEGRPEHVKPGASMELVVVLENLGRGPSPPSFLRASLVPVGAGADAPGTEIGAAPLSRLSRGEARDFVVDTRVPRGIDAGRYTLRLEADPEQRVRELSETNNVLETPALDVGALRISPAVVDFGVVAPGCSSPTEVTLENVGAARSFVGEVRLEGPSVFRLDPVAVPFALPGGRSAKLTLEYAPQTLGPSIGRLILESDAYPEARELPVRGEARFNPVREDERRQRPGPEIDVVLVVQNGCARPGCPLLEEQRSLLDAIPLFRQTASALRADWRLLVTTTDPRSGRLGRLRGPPIGPQTPNLTREVARQVLAGASGSPRPSGLAAAAEVLGSGVLRPEVGVLVVVLALDDDRSSGAPASWVDRMRAALGGRGRERLRLSAIVSPPPDGCAIAEPAPRYARAATLTGGVLSSICDIDDFGALFEWGSDELGLAWRFPLARRPVTPATIEVEIDFQVFPAFDQVDGTQRWTYDAATNSVVFTPGHVPPAGSRVTIRYRSRC